MSPTPPDHEPHRADLHKDPARVSGMFDEVAPGYDRTNTVLSMGNDRFWRAATTRAVAPRKGQRILDLAAGTGASSVSLARSGAQVIAADFSPGMIAEGKRRHGPGSPGAASRISRSCRPTRPICRSAMASSMR